MRFLSVHLLRGNLAYERVKLAWQADQLRCLRGIVLDVFHCVRPLSFYVFYHNCFRVFVSHFKSRLGILKQCLDRVHQKLRVLYVLYHFFPAFYLPLVSLYAKDQIKL